jgi:hypothetical protein
MLAVFSRAELVAWLDTAAPAMARQMMLAEAAERLLRWNRGPEAPDGNGAGRDRVPGHELHLT